MIVICLFAQLTYPRPWSNMFLKEKRSYLVHFTLKNISVLLVMVVFLDLIIFVGVAGALKKMNCSVPIRKFVWLLLTYPISTPVMKHWKKTKL